MTVVTISNVTRYALVGTNAYQLDVYMRTLGPVDSTGFQWFALTEPSFDWQYPCECAEAGCVTGAVKVFVIIDYTLPTWEPPANASQTLVGQWMFFEGALTEHEQGHGDLASACGLMLGEALASIVPQATCEGVGGAVAAVTQPVFDECRAAQRAYEDETAHGQRDGVVWPP